MTQNSPTTPPTPLYRAIATAVEAMANCERSSNIEWLDRWRARIETLVSDQMPSGAGFDNGTTFDFGASHNAKLVFHTSFHHMNDVGMYDGWTEHSVVVTPSFDGFALRVTGRDHNDIKDYIAECFDTSLREPAPALIVETETAS